MCPFLKNTLEKGAYARLAPASRETAQPGLSFFQARELVPTPASRSVSGNSNVPLFARLSICNAFCSGSFMDVWQPLQF